MSRVSEGRIVLGDVTNRAEKRGFSSISGDLGVKSGGGYGKKEVTDDGDSRFAKQVCLGVENLVREKCETKFGDHDKEKGPLALKENQAAGDSEPNNGESDASEENTMSDGGECKPIIETNKRPSSVDSGNAVAFERVALTESAGDAAGDSCESSQSMSMGSVHCKKQSDNDNDNNGRRLTLNTAHGNSPGDVFFSREYLSDDDDADVDGLASSKYVIDCSGSSEPQDLKPFGLRGCTALKGDGCSNLTAGADLLKDCSCSFCLKAAYIWSDLHYQDIKGRLAALKKSQKEASFLVSKYPSGKQNDIYVQGNSNKSSKLEADLTGQWRSLFHRMEDVFVHESNQLQASFATLKGLRENCKLDLEKASGMHSQNL